MIEAIIIILILVGIVLYLIVRASDETRTFKAEKNKVKISIFSLAKQNVQLFAKNCRLKSELRKEKETNADLRSEHEEYIILKQKYNSLENKIKELDSSKNQSSSN